MDETVRITFGTLCIICTMTVSYLLVKDYEEDVWDDEILFRRIMVCIGIGLMWFLFGIMYI